PGDDRERNGAEHDGGQDQVRDDRLEGALLARQQAVDQHQPGGGPDEVPNVDTARDRGPVQVPREQDDEQQAPPEDRHRVADEGGAHQPLVDDGAATGGGEDAGRDAQHDGEDDGAQRELDRRREQRQELLDH